MVQLNSILGIWAFLVQKDIPPILTTQKYAYFNRLALYKY